MGFFKDILDIASKHNAKKNEGSAIYVCPKCGEKKRIHDYQYKEKNAPKELACPNCGARMERRTLFK